MSGRNTPDEHMVEQFAAVGFNVDFPDHPYVSKKLRGRSRVVSYSGDAFNLDGKEALTGFDAGFAELCFRNSGVQAHYEGGTKRDESGWGTAAAIGIGIIGLFAVTAIGWGQTAAGYRYARNMLDDGYTRAEARQFYEEHQKRAPLYNKFMMRLAKPGFDLAVGRN